LSATCPGGQLAFSAGNCTGHSSIFYTLSAAGPGGQLPFFQQRTVRGILAFFFTLSATGPGGHQAAGKWSALPSLHQSALLVRYTDKKENQIFLIYKEIQNGAVAKSHMMTNDLLKCMGKYLRISPYIRKPFLISSFSFFISVHTLVQAFG
jgi:hypothetical protein